MLYSFSHEVIKENKNRFIHTLSIIRYSHVVIFHIHPVNVQLGNQQIWFPLQATFITTESIIIQSFNSFTVTDETIHQEKTKWVALTSIASDYIHILMPPWSRILLEKLTFRQ